MEDFEDTINTKSNNEIIDNLDLFNQEYHTKLTLNTNNIDLHKKKIGNEGLKLLSTIPFHYLNINMLNLSDNNISDITPLLKMNLDKLIHLDISQNRIENIDIFENLNLEHLENLNIFSNKLKHFKSLIKSNLINLRNLILGGNNIDNINDLEFMNCPNLEILDFYDNSIKDISVFERINLPNLHELSFANNYFDHEVIKNYDIISNLRKRGCNVNIYGTIKQIRNLL